VDVLLVHHPEHRGVRHGGGEVRAGRPLLQAERLSRHPHQVICEPIQELGIRVSDPHPFYADQDPGFGIHADLDPGLDFFSNVIPKV